MYLDSHTHMISRTTDDYERMAAAGVVACIEPAFWLGQPRTHVGTYIDYLSLICGFERFRAGLERHGVETDPWWGSQLSLCLLGTLVQFGWEKALGDRDELGLDWRHLGVQVDEGNRILLGVVEDPDDDPHEHACPDECAACRHRREV